MKPVPKYKKKILLRLFNKLLFVKKQQDIDPTDMQEVANIVVQDFLVILHKLFVINLGNVGIKEFSYEQSLKFFTLAKQGTTLEVYITDVIKTISNISKHGMGFAPGMITYSKTTHRNLNCLGKAAVLGALLHAMKFKIKFGLVSDHAVVIVYLDSGLYFCDPTNNEMKKLHGTFVEHSGYDWYTCSPKDELVFGHLIFQNFHLGILHAIFESLEAYSLKLFNLKPKARMTMEYARPVLVFGWGSIRKKFFSDLNGYRTEYQLEYLREFLTISYMRKLNEVKNRYVGVLRKAVGKVLRKSSREVQGKEITSFFDNTIPLMRSRKRIILRYLKNGVALPPTLNEDTHIFLQQLHQLSKKDKMLHEYTIDQIEHRLNKTQSKRLTKK